MSKKSKAPATAPVVAPVTRGKAAPHFAKFREILKGEGLTVAQICEQLGLSDKDARGVIDAMRAKEGKGAILNVFSEKAGKKVFRYTA